MSAMQLTSVGPVEGGPSRFGQAVSDACAALQGRAEVVVAYLPIRPKAELRTYLAAAADASNGAAVVGMTTGGAAFTERGVTRDGAVAAVLGADVSVRVAVARDIRDARTEATPSARRARAWLRALSLDARDDGRLRGRR